MLRTRTSARRATMKKKEGGGGREKMTKHTSLGLRGLLEQRSLLEPPVRNPTCRAFHVQTPPL